MVKILLKVPLSNTQDFDISAIVLYMKYAKHRFCYQTVKLSKITRSFYSNIFTFTRFAALKLSSVINLNSLKNSIIFQDHSHGKFKESLTRK